MDLKTLPINDVNFTNLCTFISIESTVGSFCSLVQTFYSIYWDAIESTLAKAFLKTGNKVGYICEFLTDFY